MSEPEKWLEGHIVEAHRYGEHFDYDIGVKGGRVEVMIRIDVSLAWYKSHLEHLLKFEPGVEIAIREVKP